MKIAHYQDIYVAVGEKVTRVRHDKKMSQIDLAAKVGMSRASIVNIEKGRQHPPLHLLWQLADALDVELFDLLPNRNEIRSNHTSALLNMAEVAGSEDSAAKLAEFINMHLGRSDDQQKTI